MHTSRSKPQLPPEFNSNNELTGTDDSPALMELRQMLGNLTTALAMMSSRMDQFQASSVDITSAQPMAAVLSAQHGTSPGGNSTATFSHMALVSA